MEITDARPDVAVSRASRFPWRSVLSVLAAGLVAVLVPLVDYTGFYLESPARPPAGSRATLGALADMARAVPAYYSHRLGEGPEVVELSLTLRPEHLQRLKEERDEAMRVGVLLSSGRSWVPAALRVGEQDVAARVRLKGDLSDHWSRGRWSLRCEVAGGVSVLGLRRFSLHPPWARGFHREPLFFDGLRSQGLMAPRTDFVDFTLNGRHLGLMELEEHFAAELPAAHGRPPGVLFRLDESRLWREWVAAAERLGVRWSIDVPKPRDADDWRQAPIDPFEAGAVSASPELSRAFEAAARNFERVRSGELAPSALFEPRAWGSFLAHCEVFGATHMALWNNLRFYLDPTTGQLEPVAFDSGVTPHREHPRIDGAVAFSCLGGELDLTATLASDPKIRSALFEALARLGQELQRPPTEDSWRERELRYLSVLRREYPWLEPFDLAAVRRRATALGAVSEPSFWEHVQPTVKRDDSRQPFR